MKFIKKCIECKEEFIIDNHKDYLHKKICNECYFQIYESYPE